MDAKWDDRLLHPLDRSANARKNERAINFNKLGSMPFDQQVTSTMLTRIFCTSESCWKWNSSGKRRKESACFEFDQLIYTSLAEGFWSKRSWRIWSWRVLSSFRKTVYPTLRSTCPRMQRAADSQWRMKSKETKISLATEQQDLLESAQFGWLKFRTWYSVEHSTTQPHCILRLLTSTGQRMMGPTNIRAAICNRQARASHKNDDEGSRGILTISNDLAPLIFNGCR